MSALRWLSTMPPKVRDFLLYGRAEAELDEEVRYHLDRKTDVYIAQGLSRRQARLAARRDFGGVERWKEHCRTSRGWALWLEQVRQDVGYGVRILGRAPAFAGVAVVTLMLGIGANAAIFTLLDGVMFKPLEVPNAGELVQLQWTDENGPDPQRGIGPKARFSYPAFERFRSALPSGSELAAMSRVAPLTVTVGESVQARSAYGQLVSGEYFSLLRIAPSHGRLLDGGDSQRIDGHPVAVLSHAFWQELGGRDDIVGQRAIINDVPFVVVGVAGEGFDGVWADIDTDLWLPVSMQHAITYRQNFSVGPGGRFDAPWLAQEAVTWLTLVARVPDLLREPFATATDRVHRATLLAQGDALGIPPADLAAGLAARQLLRTPFRGGLSELRVEFASPLFLLMGLVGLVLLVACVNVANLLLARGVARTREIGLRLSLGATRSRVTRQLLTESLVLALVGGVLGVVLGWWLSRGLASLAEVGELPVDLRVLGFSLAVSMGAAVIFGTWPALAARGVELSRMTTMSGGGGRVFGAARMKPLVALQSALTFIVVVGAVLFAQSLANLTSIDPGFESRQLVSVTFNPTASGYPADMQPALQRRLLAQSESVPGVASVALAGCGLASGCRNSQTVRFEGYEPGPDEDVQIWVGAAGPGYFETAGIIVEEGRAIDARDIAAGARVVVVNRALVDRYFGARSPVGTRMGRGASGPIDFEIVGVVADARMNDLMEAPVPMAFGAFGEAVPGPWVLHARVSGEPAAVLRDLQAAIARQEPGLVIERALTIGQLLQRNVREPRLIAYLAAGFAALVTLMACVGLYGVTSYSVARRTGEIGVRLALGARPTTVLRRVLLESAGISGVGIAFGVIGALVLGGAVSAMLYGVSPSEPLAYVAVVLLLMGSGTLACLLPARRAAHVDPSQALRAE